jgi:hypothetical protein
LPRSACGSSKQWTPRVSSNNLLNGFRVHGKVDPGLLERSFEVITGRQEVLRTNLFVKDGLIYQNIGAPKPVPLKCTDLTGFPRDGLMERAERLLFAEASQPFDLGNEPLARLRLVKLGTNDFLMGIISHHAIWDGWSTSIMIKELATVYENLSAGRDPAYMLPPLTTQYADFSTWQRNKFDGGEYDGQMKYWQDRLCGELPVLEHSLISHCTLIKGAKLRRPAKTTFYSPPSTPRLFYNRHT